MEVMVSKTTALSSLWVFVGVVFIFVGLRLYTRLYLIDRHGPDDLAYTAGSLLLAAHAALMQVSARYGFGEDINTLSDEDAAKAKMWEMISLTVAFIAMAVAKWSLGLFLLRIMVKKSQRITIWSMMTSLLLVSLIVCVLFWVHCLPPSSLFDRRVQGRCHFDDLIFLKFLGMWGVAADLLFAILPWITLKNLNTSKRERHMIAGSMSLGFVAGICGITRNVQLAALQAENYTEGTTSFVVWTAAEIFVTLICTGIPVLWPLVHHWSPRFSSYSKSISKGNRDKEREGPVFALHTIGGSAMLPPGTPDNDDGLYPTSPAYLGPCSSSTVTRVTSYPCHVGSDGGSEEEILQPGDVGGGKVARNSDKILVRDEFSIELASASESRPR